MAIDFPASPTNGQTFTSGSVTYTFDGTKWTAETGSVSLSKIEVGNTKAEIVDTGSDGRFVVTTEGTERARVDSSGLAFDSGYGSVATAYGCRAWVNFNGEGTLTILESGNVSSITDNGIGEYTVNFTTAMPDADYSATGIATYNGGGFNDPTVIGQDNTTPSSTSSFPFYTFRIGVGLSDSAPCMLAFFR
jgi:hypothetical protein